MKSNIIIFILTILSLFSCSNDDDAITNNSKSLVFGSFYGECIGDCFNIFKIDNKTLEEDRITDFFSGSYEFTSSFIYDNELFVMYQSILREIPGELINGSDKAYGCPDCADQGGFYIELVTLEGVTKKYTIDTNNTQDQSVVIIEFKNKIRNIIENLIPN